MDEYIKTRFLAKQFSSLFNFLIPHRGLLRAKRWIEKRLTTLAWFLVNYQYSLSDNHLYINRYL